MAAITELVVPRSIPTALAMSCLLESLLPDCARRRFVTAGQASRINVAPSERSPHHLIAWSEGSRQRWRHYAIAGFASVSGLRWSTDLCYAKGRRILARQS